MIHFKTLFIRPPSDPQIKVSSDKWKWIWWPPLTHTRGRAKIICSFIVNCRKSWLMSGWKVMWWFSTFLLFMSTEVRNMSGALLTNQVLYANEHIVICHIQLLFISQSARCHIQMYVWWLAYRRWRTDYSGSLNFVSPLQYPFRRYLLKRLPNSLNQNYWATFIDFNPGRIIPGINSAFWVS